MTWSYHIDSRQGGPVFQHEAGDFQTVAAALDHIREGFDFEKAETVEIWLEREEQS
jgi:hypothetical protein